MHGGRLLCRILRLQIVIDVVISGLPEFVAVRLIDGSPRQLHLISGPIRFNVEASFPEHHVVAASIFYVAFALTA